MSTKICKYEKIKLPKHVYEEAEKLREELDLTKTMFCRTAIEHYLNYRNITEILKKPESKMIMSITNLISAHESKIHLINLEIEDSELVPFQRNIELKIEKEMCEKFIKELKNLIY